MSSQTVEKLRSTASNNREKIERKEIDWMNFTMQNANGSIEEPLALLAFRSLRFSLSIKSTSCYNVVLLSVLLWIEITSTPAKISMQPAIFVTDNVSPRRIQPNRTLVTGSKVLRIAAAEAPTCLIPSWTRQSATTLHRIEKTAERIQAFGVNDEMFRFPDKLPAKNIQSAAVAAR